MSAGPILVQMLIPILRPFSDFTRPPGDAWREWRRKRWTDGRQVVTVEAGNGYMKKAVLKRTADAMEKLAIGSMLVGLFQEQQAGIWIGLGCMALSYILTMWEAKI